MKPKATLPDVRNLPLYGFAEAAHYLKIPTSTLRAWGLGQNYVTVGGTKFFKPVLELPDQNLNLLSFVNLVEAHVLAAIRRIHKVRLQEVRRAIGYLKKEFPKSEHPLAEKSFLTDGKNLFVKEYGQLINVSQTGQLEIEKVLDLYLHRIEHDAKGFPLNLYPFTKAPDLKKSGVQRADAPKIIVINPYICFGRPFLAGAGVPTEIIHERFQAGESIEELAEDYGRGADEIEEAIRYESDRKAA